MFVYCQILQMNQEQLTQQLHTAQQISARNITPNCTLGTSMDLTPAAATTAAAPQGYPKRDTTSTDRATAAVSAHGAIAAAAAPAGDDWAIVATAMLASQAPPGSNGQGNNVGSRDQDIEGEQSDVDSAVTAGGGGRGADDATGTGAGCDTCKPPAKLTTTDRAHCTNVSHTKTQQQQQQQQPQQQQMQEQPEQEGEEKASNHSNNKGVLQHQQQPTSALLTAAKQQQSEATQQCQQLQHIKPGPAAAATTVAAGVDGPMSFKTPRMPGEPEPRDKTAAAAAGTIGVATAMG